MRNCATSSASKGNSWSSDLLSGDCFPIRIPRPTAAIPTSLARSPETVPYTPVLDQYQSERLVVAAAVKVARAEAIAAPAPRQCKVLPKELSEERWKVRDDHGTEAGGGRLAQAESRRRAERWRRRPPLRPKTSARSCSTGTQEKGRRPNRKDGPNSLGKRRHTFPIGWRSIGASFDFLLRCLEHRDFGRIASTSVANETSICGQLRRAPGESVRCGQQGRLLWRIEIKSRSPTERGACNNSCKSLSTRPPKSRPNQSLRSAVPFFQTLVTYNTCPRAVTCGAPWTATGDQRLLAGIRNARSGGWASARASKKARTPTEGWAKIAPISCESLNE
jgi:hypothetical protein